MKLMAHPLCLLGAAGLVLAGCTEMEPAASGDANATAAASPDVPVSSNADATPPSTAPSAEQPGDCNADEAQRFVGQPADSPTRTRLLEAVAPVSTVRWVGPGDATTEDYSPSRLNVMLDVGGTIRSAHCG